MTMPAHSDPQADLLQAFLQTDYRVLPRTDALGVVIGDYHPQLDEIIEQRDWAILTAFNPGASVDEPDANEHRHQQLLAAIADAGLDFLPACNRDPAGRWPDEPSLLMIGAEAEWLIALARRLGQLALVAGRPGRIAELWLVGGDWPEALPAPVRRMHR
jgi:hypothetical protein